MSHFKYAAFLIVCISIFSCSKDIEIGADLLDDQNINIAFTDTLTLSANTVEGDSAVSFFESLFFDKRTHLIGRIDDPVFGISEAVIYTNATLGFGSPNFEENSTLDSLVLVLPFDSLGKYGDLDAAINFEVYHMNESLRSIVDAQDSIFSNEGFDYTDLLGSTQLTPSYIDSSEIKTPDTDTIRLETIPKELRIHIDPAIGESILTDSSLTSNDTILQDYLKGFVLRSDGAANSIAGLDLLPGAGASLNLYYTTPEDAKRLFSFQVGQIRHNELIHDYTGSDVEQALSDPESTDLLYVQSMAGTNVSFDLASVKDIGNKIVNKAELELSLAELATDDLDLYPPVFNMLAAYRNEDNSLAFPRDVSIVNTLLGRNPSVDELISAFGGEVSLDQSNGIRKYTFNITNHVLDIRNGDVETTFVELLSYVKQQRPNRSILYGPSHPDNNLKAKLKLILTSP